MKNSKHRIAGGWVVLVVIAVVLAAGLVGCGESETEESVSTAPTSTAPTSGGVTAAVEEWNVPVLTVLTGPAAAFGLDREWCIKYVAELINAAGGVNGAPIKITSYDTGMGDAAKGVSAMTQALGTDPLCILGPIDNTAAQAGGYLAVEENVPFVSAFDTPEDLAATAPCGICDGPFYGDTTKASIKEWIRLNPDIKSVVVLLTPEMFASMRTPATDELAELGIEVLDVVEVSPPGALDLSPIATKAMAKNPDGYCCMLTGADYGRFCKAMSERGMTEGRRILSSFVALGGELFTVGEGYTEDTYIYDMVDYTSQDPEWVAYCEAYAAAHDGNPPYTPATYGGAQMMLALQAALEQEEITGDPSALEEERGKIRDFLLNAGGISDMQGGTFSYENGAKKMTLYMYQIKDNQLSRVSEVTG